MPLVFDIVRGSLVDGPGIRTVIFLKGCPLRCAWCHNPEGLDPAREVVFFSGLCIACGECLDACPNDAIDLFAADRIDRHRCERCAACAESCDSLALKSVGETYSAEKLLDLILRDKIFFDTSGGGVTFSGGEPLMHMSFLNRLLRKLKSNGIHVAVETCGHFDLSVFTRSVMPWVDLLLYDLKLIDEQAHNRYTGKSNAKILNNLDELSRNDNIRIEPRIPLIPGITATEENLSSFARLIAKLGFTSCSLLSYNPSGLNKWAGLGQWKPDGVPESPLSFQEEEKWRLFFHEELARHESDVRKPHRLGK